MRSLVLAVTLLLSTTVIAQKNKVGLTVSPNYAYRFYQSDHPIFSSPLINEVPKLGYRITANYERSFHERASFFVGLSFTNNGYQTEEVAALYSTTPPPNSPRAFWIRTSLYQVGIPIGVNLFIPIKKIGLFFSSGVAVNYLANIKNTRITINTADEIDKSTSNGNKGLYKPLSFAAFGSFGIEFGLSEKLVMRIAPNIHYTFTNIMNDRVVYKVYPTSSGINIGIIQQL